MIRVMGLAALMVGSAACSGTSKETDTEAGLACDERSAEDCGGCVEIDGRPATEDTASACYDLGDAEVFGCMDTGTGCTEAETWASPPDEDACYWFNNGCIPAGWTVCEYLETCE